MFGRNVTKAGRVLPYFNVTECIFTLNPSKIRFNLGGNILLSIVDILLPLIQGLFTGTIESLVKDTVMKNGPELINTAIWKSDGFLTLRDLSNSTFPPGDPMGDLTLDYQLEDAITVSEERLELGINGTLFNRDVGYTLPDTEAVPMPTYDPKMDAQFQVFISNYLFNSVGKGYF